MSQLFNSGAASRLLGSKVPAVNPPIGAGLWVYTPGGQGVQFLSFQDPASNKVFYELGLDVTSASNKPNVEVSNAAGNGQILGPAALPLNTWVHLIMAIAANGAPSLWVNGVPVTPGSGGRLAATIGETLLSGNKETAGGQRAHAWTIARAPTANEAAYIGNGGNPQNLSGITDYWKIQTVGGVPVNPVPDLIGGNNPLTGTGMAAGISDPPMESFFIGPPIQNFSFPLGQAIAPFNFGALFDGVSSPFTCALQQLGVGTPVTTVAGASGTGREVQLASLGSFNPGDYIQFGATGAPTRVLETTPAAGSLLFATDQSWTVGEQVFRYPVQPLAVPGLNLTANVWTGTTAGAGLNQPCLVRAVCNARPSLFADSNLFSVQVLASLPPFLSRPKRKRTRFVKTYQRY